MNEKHKDFVFKYLENGKNGTQAYKDLYPNVKSDEAAATSATRLLKNDKVQQLIKDETAKTAAALGITREEIVNKILLIVNNNETTSPTIALKGLEMINKMFGYDAPLKQDITTNGKDINSDIKIKIIRPKQQDEE